MHNNVLNKTILKESVFVRGGGGGDLCLFNLLSNALKSSFRENTEHHSSAGRTSDVSLSLIFANMFTSYDHPLYLSSSLVNLKRRITVLADDFFKRLLF